jgi:hypothetical protein
MSPCTTGHTRPATPVHFTVRPLFPASRRFRRLILAQSQGRRLGIVADREMFV